MFLSVLLYGIKVQILLTSTPKDLPIDSEATFLRNEPLDGFVSHENIFPPLMAQCKNIAKELAPEPVSTKFNFFLFFFLKVSNNSNNAKHSVSGIPLAHLGNNLFTKSDPGSL